MTTHSPQPTQDYPEGPKVAQNSILTAGTHGCARCPNRWGGFKTAHCGACHRTFTGLTAFDKHRTGSHTNDTRHCLPPESVGLVNAGRAYPCWGFSGEGDDRWADDDE